MSPSRNRRSTHAWLLGELAEWRAEGLIDESAARAIAARYGDDEGHVSGPVFAIYLIGSLLIGGGILAFVGWNWDALPDAGKLALGAGSLVLANVLGFWMWKVDGRRPLLGQALVLLGSLLFGANIGIVSQVYQLDGEFWSAAALWGAGALVVAVLMRSAANAMLGTWLALFWAIGFVEDAQVWWPPLALAFVGVPLAFWLRSSALFASAVIVSAVALACVPIGFNQGEAVVTSLLATCAVLAITPFALSRSQHAFGMVALVLSTVGLVVLGYLLSFREVADEVSIADMTDNVWLAGVAPQAVLALLLGLRTALTRPNAFGERPYGVILFICTLLVAGGTLLPEPEVPLAMLANLALVLVAGWSIVVSMNTFDRRAYWAGATLIGLVIVSRFIEYQTGLLTKAVVFTLCGVAVIVFGLAFERRARAAGLGSGSEGLR